MQLECSILRLHFFMTFQLMTHKLCSRLEHSFSICIFGLKVTFDYRADRRHNLLEGPSPMDLENIGWAYGGGSIAYSETLGGLGLPSPKFYRPWIRILDFKHFICKYEYLKTLIS